MNSLKAAYEATLSFHSRPHPRPRRLRTFPIFANGLVAGRYWLLLRKRYPTSSPQRRLLDSRRSWQQDAAQALKPLTCTQGASTAKQAPCSSAVHCAYAGADRDPCEGISLVVTASAYGLLQGCRFRVRGMIDF